MKNSALTRPQLLIVVAIVGCVGVIKALPLITEQNRLVAYRRQMQCQENLKQIGLCLMQYEQDYDDRFPPARTGASTGWSDALAPYGLRPMTTYPGGARTNLLDCPEGKDGVGKTTDYFFNSRLSRISQSRLKNPFAIIVLGDGLDNAPSNATLSSLPTSWINNPSSPAQRHLINTQRYANYGFADGHVKSIRSDRIGSTATGDNQYQTFAIH